MTTLKFDATPTPSEGISLDDISEDKMKAAWKDYESKPEYKKFNKLKGLRPCFGTCS